MGSATTREGADWVTLRTAAKITGKSVKTMRRWASEGKVLAQKDDKGYWFLRRQDVLEAEPVAEAKAEAKAELVVLSETMEKMQASFHALAEDLASASERAGRAEAQIETAESNRDRLAFEVAELRTRLESELSRRWWKRRSRGETVTHLPPHLGELPPLDPDQLEVRKAKLEALRDGTPEPSDENNEPEKT